MNKILEKIGLSPVEIKVYLTLLKNGPLLAGKIAKIAEINRTNCYDAIKRLIEKGLVGFVVKANRKTFHAQPPDNLITLLNDKKEKLENDLNEDTKLISSIIPKLKKLYKEKDEQQVTVYEGKKGIKSLLDHMLAQKKEIILLGVAKEISEILTYYLIRFHKQRIKLKIPIKLILSDNLQNTRGAELKKMKYTQVKFLPDEYCSSSTTNVYGDYTAIFLWSEKPLGILVKNKEIALSHKNDFKLLWGIAKK